MRVRFTTTGPAGPRRQYVVWLFTGQSHPHQQCNPESATWDILGGVGKTVEVVLDAEEFYENARFCFGRAELVVWTTSAEHEQKERKELRKVFFTIHRR